MIGFGRCHISPILEVRAGFPTPQKNFPQPFPWATTFFCILMTRFNESKNKKAFSIDVMVALLALGLYLF